MTTFQKVFRVFSILTIVAAAVLLVLGGFLIGENALFGMLSASGGTLSVIYLAVMLLVSGFFELATGISGVQLASHPRRYWPALVCAIVHLSYRLFSFFIDFSAKSVLYALFCAAMVFAVWWIAARGTCPDEGCRRCADKGSRKLVPATVRGRLVLCATATAGCTLAMCLVGFALHGYVGVANLVAPSTSETALAADENGLIVTQAPYYSEVKTKTTPEMEIRFDDSWFGGSSYDYNHDLATTSMGLSVLANSEAQYYNGSGGTTAYLEDTLTRLGFADIDTSSYYHRSISLDEVASVVTDDSDVVAYGLARKDLPQADGTTKTLVLVTIRGTWGAEWLSNFRMLDESTADAAGFSKAATRLVSRLAEYTTSLGLDPDSTEILICGHSRGGSVTNLVAARLDEMAGTADALAPASSIYAYGFAVSRVTENESAADALYNNIYSINCPSDIVANVPLSEWGYTRYGRNILLPREGDEGYDSIVEQVQAQADDNIGSSLPTDFYCQTDLDGFIANEAAQYSTAEEALSLTGMFHLASAAFSNNIPNVMNTHLPDNYLAWMQTTGK